MSLSQPISLYGVHSVCFYNRTTHLPISYIRVLGDVNLEFTAEKQLLQGGSSLYPWDSEISSINSVMSMTAREYPGSAMASLLGGTLTERTAEASGAIAEFVNVNGTTIKDAANGIDDVELTALDSDDLKEWKFMLEATGPGEVSLYGTSDADFKRGTNLAFEDDTLLIESGIDVSAADAVITDLGITLSQIGTPAFDTGDTAEFYIRKPNASSLEVKFGESGAEFAEVGALIASQKATNGMISFVELYRVKGYGMPINFAEKAFSEWSIEMDALYDSVKDAVGRFARSIPA